MTHEILTLNPVVSKVEPPVVSHVELSVVCYLSFGFCPLFPVFLCILVANYFVIRNSLIYIRYSLLYPPCPLCLCGEPKFKNKDMTPFFPLFDPSFPCLSLRPSRLGEREKRSLAKTLSTQRNYQFRNKDGIPCIPVLNSRAACQGLIALNILILKTKKDKMRKSTATTIIAGMMGIRAIITPIMPRIIPRIYEIRTVCFTVKPLSTS